MPMAAKLGGGGDVPSAASIYKVTWLYIQVLLRDHVTN